PSPAALAPAPRRRGRDARRHRASSPASRPLVAVVEGLVAVVAREQIALGQRQVLARHLRDQVLETDLRLPAELRLRLACVAEQAAHLRGPEIVWIDPHHGLAALERGEAVVARARDTRRLVLAAALPVELDAVFGRHRVDEVTDAALNTGRDDEVFRRRQ